MIKETKETYILDIFYSTDCNFLNLFQFRKKNMVVLYVQIWNIIQELIAASDFPNTSPVTSTPEGGA